MQINKIFVFDISNMNSKHFVVVAVMTAMLVGATAFATADSAFAGKKREYNQATSQTNACGNGEGGLIDSTIIPVGPTNVFCQNVGSQIQGDENAAALTGTQQGDD
jgi:hypothetical protein